MCLCAVYVGQRSFVVEPPGVKFISRMKNPEQGLAGVLNT